MADYSQILTRVQYCKESSFIGENACLLSKYKLPYEEEPPGVLLRFSFRLPYRSHMIYLRSDPGPDLTMQFVFVAWRS